MRAGRLPFAMVALLLSTASVIAGGTAPTGKPRVDRFGDPLPAEALMRLGTVRFRNSEPFVSLAFTHDGRFLVSGGSGGAVVWDAATGKGAAAH
jgi:hypothetical protein